MIERKNFLNCSFCSKKQAVIKKCVLFLFSMTVGLLFLAGCAEENRTDLKNEGETEISEAESKGETEMPEIESEEEGQKKMESDTMKITVGDIVFTASLADNSSVQALKELLAEGPLTINMSDYGNMEKVGPIGTNLPRNDEQISTGAGDIILYQGNSLVIYYDTNSWDFTRIGKIEDVTREELLESFGTGDVKVTFSLE